MRWKHHTASAPHSSPKWATTDRGWLHLHLDEHPDAHSDTISRSYVSEHLCAGNYLHYPGRGYSASAYLIRIGPGGTSTHQIHMPQTMFSTAAEAAAAVEAALHASGLLHVHASQWRKPRSKASKAHKGYSVGAPVVCNGYPGTVVELTDRGTLVVRLSSGCVEVDPTDELEVRPQGAL